VRLHRLDKAVRAYHPLFASLDVQAKKEHKRADRVAAASEAVHVVGWTQSEVRDTLRIPYDSLSADPLLDIYGGKAWEPWQPALAAERFLAELQWLISAKDAS